ncbi:MAG: zf-TFIIB domain-containing protein [Candidatus Woesearchaeota archaeon]
MVDIDQNKKMNCPRCSSLFKKINMKKLKHPTGAILDVCESCGGMWLDRDEVNLLYEKTKGGKNGKK